MSLPLAQVMGQPTAPASSPSALAKPPANAPYRNASLAVDARVADLPARMTHEEKVAQNIPLWDSRDDVKNADTTDRKNVGSGKSVTVRLSPGGSGFFKTQTALR